MSLSYHTMNTDHYPTDLTDTEWDLLAPHLPVAASVGRPRTHSCRALLEAIFSVIRSGCARRGKTSPTTYVGGDWVRHGNDCTPRCGRRCEGSRGVRRRLRRGSGTARVSRRLVSVGRAATLVAKRSADANGNSRWTPRDWCCGHGCMRRGSWIAMGSCCCSGRESHRYIIGFDDVSAHDSASPQPSWHGKPPASLPP
jgi:transposase